MHERRLYLQEFLAADEAFISSTVSEVMPVVQVDEAVLSRGRKGLVTARLQAAYTAFKKDHLE